MKVEYEKELETDDSETESETQYRVNFLRLLEYRKAQQDGPVVTNGDNAYVWDVDEVVQSINLDEFEGLSDVVTDAAGITSSFSATTTDGMVTFTFTISRGGEGQRVTANKMKVDFELRDFPWQGSGDTYIALVSSVETERKIEVDYDKDHQDQGEVKEVMISFADALDTTGTMPFGEFTWANDAIVMEMDAMNATTATSKKVPVEASVDGETIRVIATSPFVATPLFMSDSGTRATSVEMIAFSFIGPAAPSAQYLYWDPEAGIGYSGTSAAPPASSIFSGAFFMGAMVWMFVAM